MTDERVRYNFHEPVVDPFRLMHKERVKSFVVAAPMKTTCAVDVLDHVRKHHTYLVQSNSPNRATFAKLFGSADQPDRVAELVKSKESYELITGTTSGEADHIVNALEKHLCNVGSN